MVERYGQYFRAIDRARDLYRWRIRGKLITTLHTLQKVSIKEKARKLRSVLVAMLEKVHIKEDVKRLQSSLVSALRRIRTEESLKNLKNSHRHDNDAVTEKHETKTTSDFFHITDMAYLDNSYYQVVPFTVSRLLRIMVVIAKKVDLR